jgi:hypothetical protein
MSLHEVMLVKLAKHQVNTTLKYLIPFPHGSYKARQ